MQYLRGRIPNFRPLCHTISRFQDITYFRIFALTPMLKFQIATKVLIFGRSPKEITTLYPCMTVWFIVRFGSDQIKTVGEVAF